MLTERLNSLVEIRQYISNDLADVISSWESASKIGHPFLSDEFLKQERSNIPAVYLKSGETWVAEIDNSVVGFTILHGSDVGALFVDSNFHGSGVGYALMNRAKEIHGDLTVDVFKDNLIGKKFYSRNGFRFVREYYHEQSGMIMLCLEYKKNN